MSCPFNYAFLAPARPLLFPGMPITQSLVRPGDRDRRWPGLLLAFCLAAHAQAGEPPAPAVAVVRSAAWSPNGAAREGAEELTVLMSVARLQASNPVTGLVGVGDRQGMFKPGTEETLRFVVLTGVPVARVSFSGFVPHSDGLFIEAGALDEAVAAQRLQACLVRFGPPPAARNPHRPSAAELSAIRTHVRQFQEAFLSAGTQTIALR